jgi:hypothetical protein
MLERKMDEAAKLGGNARSLFSTMEFFAAVFGHGNGLS